MTNRTKAAIANKPQAWRAAPARSTPKARIERDGGDYGAGLIRQASLITRGEAIGHDRWIDGEMLTAVADKVNASKAGIKGRFTHPGLSSDGLGKFLGRWKNAEVVGDRVLADLHLAETAHNTPDGDLADYVVGLADEDPQALAVSIVFWPDAGAEQRHVAEHTDAEGEFQSPDADNTRNYPHARLAKLDAADVVDEPAANPDGLFHRGQELPSEAVGLLEYALLDGEAPPTAELGINAERARQFIRRVLSERDDLRSAVAALGNRIETQSAGTVPAASDEPGSAAGSDTAQGGHAMANESKGGTAPTPAAAPAPNTTPATFKELKAAFPNAGSAFREQCMENQLDIAAATQAYIASIDAERAALATQISKLRDELATANQRAFEAETRSQNIGQSGTAVSGGKPKTYGDNETGWKAEFDESPQLQDEFETAERYVAYRRNLKAGNVHLK